MLGKILEDLNFNPFLAGLFLPTFFKFHILTEFLRPFISAIFRDGGRELKKF